MKPCRQLLKILPSFGRESINCKSKSRDCSGQFVIWLLEQDILSFVPELVRWTVSVHSETERFSSFFETTENVLTSHGIERALHQKRCRFQMHQSERTNFILPPWICRSSVRKSHFRDPLMVADMLRNQASGKRQQNILWIFWQNLPADSQFTPYLATNPFSWSCEGDLAM